MVDFPEGYIVGMTRHLRSSVATTESPFSFNQQIQDFGGERWEATLDVNVKGLAFEAFSNHYLGKRLPFELPWPLPPIEVAPVIDAFLSVSGTGSAGNTLVVAGDWGSLEEIPAGSFFSIFQGGRHKLYQLTEPAQVNLADPDAPVSLRIQPRLRGTPTDGLILEFAMPRLTVRSIGPAPATVGNFLHNFKIDLVEVI